MGVRATFLLRSAAILMMASVALSAQASAQSVLKVGFIAPLSGPFAQLGESLDRGAKLYEKIHGKGVPVQVIRRDDAGVPDNTRRIAQELIVRDGVKILTGIALSPQ